MRPLTMSTAASPARRSCWFLSARSMLRATPASMRKLPASSLKSVRSVRVARISVSCFRLSAALAVRRFLARLTPFTTPSRSCSEALPFRRDLSSARVRPALSISTSTRPVPSSRSLSATSFSTSLSTSFSTACSATPSAPAFSATRLARASANRLPSTTPPQARPLKPLTRSMPASSVASSATSVARYWRSARLPMRRPRLPFTLRNGARSMGALSLAAHEPACGAASNPFRSSELKRTSAFTFGVMPASAAEPSVLKALAFTSPSRFQRALPGVAVAMPFNARVSGFRPGSSRRNCRSILSSSAVRLGGCSTSSLRSPPTMRRDAAALLRRASNAGTRTLSKLPLGASLLKVTDSGIASPYDSLPASALPLSVSPLTSSSGQSRSSASGLPARLPLIRTFSWPIAKARRSGSSAKWSTPSVLPTRRTPAVLAVTRRFSPDADSDDRAPSHASAPLSSASMLLAPGASPL